MGIGGHSSTSVAGSPGPENMVYATVSQGSLLLPPGLEVPMSSGSAEQVPWLGQTKGESLPLTFQVMAVKTRELKQGLGAWEGGVTQALCDCDSSFPFNTSQPWLSPGVGGRQRVEDWVDAFLQCFLF